MAQAPSIQNNELVGSQMIINHEQTLPRTPLISICDLTKKEKECGLATWTLQPTKKTRVLTWASPYITEPKDTHRPYYSSIIDSTVDILDSISLILFLSAQAEIGGGEERARRSTDGPKLANFKGEVVTGHRG